MNFDSMDDLSALALTMIGEGRGEPIESLVAIGSVIINRSIILKKSIKEVCLAHHQFSCWNINDPNRELLIGLLEDNSFREKFPFVFYIAKGLFDIIIPDNTAKATYYMRVKLYSSAERPVWSSGAKEPVIYGHHIYFKL